MSLIKCPECKKEISDTAATCPGCGAPISEQKIASQPVITTERTSKDIKKHQAISLAMFIVGLVWIFNLQPTPETPRLAVFIPLGMIAFGAIWFLFTAGRKWWKHD